MDLRWAKAYKHGNVELGSVALVPLKTILGEALGIACHHAVAVNLGDDGGARDGENRTVAFHDGTLGHLESLYLVWSIDEDYGSWR